MTLLYDLGHGIANSREWPQWQPGSEFKGVREKSDATRQ